MCATGGARDMSGRRDSASFVGSRPSAPHELKDELTSLKDADTVEIHNHTSLH